MANDRKSRKEELLAAARDRLVEDDAGADNSSPAVPEIRYRGQVVRPSSAGTPGSGIKSGGGNNDVKAALQKIKELYREGLISRAEAEKKRTEILGRL